VLRPRDSGSAGQLQPGDDHDRPRVRPDPPTSSRSLRSSVERSSPLNGRTRLLPRWAADRAEPGRGLHDTGCSSGTASRLIGADIEAIQKGEDRQRFRRSCVRSAPTSPTAGSVTPWTRRIEFAGTVVINVVHPAELHLGGLGSGLTQMPTKVRTMVARGLAASPCTRCSSRSPCWAGRSSSSS